MNRRYNIGHRYVEIIPRELEEGILYVSRRFNTASHLCCCGCGQKIVTPLNSAKWRIIDYGSTISMSPSIGLGKLPCRSHYWIRRSRVEWCPEMTDAETEYAQIEDEYASQVFSGEIPLSAPTQAPSLVMIIRHRFFSIWIALKSWMRSLWK